MQLKLGSIVLPLKREIANFSPTQKAGLVFLWEAYCNRKSKLPAIKVA